MLVSIAFTPFQSYAAQDHNMDSDKEEQITKPLKHSQKHVAPSHAPDHWSQEIHDTIANSVYQSATWFDSFFTDIDSQQIEPKATAKIRFGWIPKARDWAEFDSRFRLKVKLPHFKDRMSLILSDEDDMADNQLPLECNDYCVACQAIQMVTPEDEPADIAAMTKRGPLYNQKLKPRVLREYTDFISHVEREYTSFELNGQYSIATVV